MKNRGLEEVSIFSIDGLIGLKEAILAAYPNSEIQGCIIHQLRNSFKYVSYKDLREFLKDFKTVYKAANEEDALENLADVEEKWGNNWDLLYPCYSKCYKEMDSKI